MEFVAKKTSKPFSIMKKITIKKLLLATILVCFSAKAQQPDPPGQVKGNEKPKNEAYLFAHMTHNYYG